MLNLSDFVGFLKQGASYLRKGYDLIPSWLRGAGLEPAGILIALTALAISLRLGLETVSTWLAYGQFSTEDILIASVVAIVVWLALGFIVLALSQSTLLLWTLVPKWTEWLLRFLVAKLPFLLEGARWVLKYSRRILVPWSYWPERINDILERCKGRTDTVPLSATPPRAVELLGQLRSRLQKLSTLSPPDLNTLDHKPGDDADRAAWIVETLSRLTAAQDEREILQQEIEIGLGKLDRVLRPCGPDAICAIRAQLQELGSFLSNLSESAARTASSATAPLVRQRIGLTLLDVVSAGPASSLPSEKPHRQPVAQRVRQDWSGALALAVAAALWLCILSWGNEPLSRIPSQPELSMAWAAKACRFTGTLILAVAPSAVLLWLARGLYWRVKILRALA